MELTTRRQGQINCLSLCVCVACRMERALLSSSQNIDQLEYHCCSVASRCMTPHSLHQLCCLGTSMSSTTVLSTTD
jgi:hypothetical protein